MKQNFISEAHRPKGSGVVLLTTLSRVRFCERVCACIRRFQQQVEDMETEARESSTSPAVHGLPLYPLQNLGLGFNCGVEDKLQKLFSCTETWTSCYVRTSCSLFRSNRVFRVK